MAKAKKKKPVKKIRKAKPKKRAVKKPRKAKKKKPVADAIPTLGRIRNFKATDAVWKIVKHKAKRHARGNISRWLRYASQNCAAPKKIL